MNQFWFIRKKSIYDNRIIVKLKHIEETIRQDFSIKLHVNLSPNDAMSEQSASTNQRKTQQARDLDCRCGTDGMQ